MTNEFGVIGILAPIAVAGALLWTYREAIVLGICIVAAVSGSIATVIAMLHGGPVGWALLGACAAALIISASGSVALTTRTA